MPCLYYEFYSFKTLGEQETLFDTCGKKNTKGIWVDAGILYVMNCNCILKLIYDICGVQHFQLYFNWFEILQISKPLFSDWFTAISEYKYYVHSQLIPIWSTAAFKLVNILLKYLCKNKNKKFQLLYCKGVGGSTVTQYKNITKTNYFKTWCRKRLLLNDYLISFTINYWTNS